MREQNSIKRDHFIFGVRAVIEAVEAGKEVEKVLIQKAVQTDLIKELINSLKKLKIPYQRVPGEKLHKLTRKNHQGVICFLSPIRYSSLDHIIESAYSIGKDPFVVVLDRVTDVRNVGAIARTMECIGAHALVVPSRGGALLSGDAMKTSAGALNILPVCRSENLKDTLIELKGFGLRIAACTEKAETVLYDTDLTGPLAIVMGSEEDGISSEYLKMSDVKVKIPMAGSISSLNVSVSAGIILYETQRQRNSTT